MTLTNQAIENFKSHQKWMIIYLIETQKITFFKLNNLC